MKPLISYLFILTLLTGISYSQSSKIEYDILFKKYGFTKLEAKAKK
jgi:hypothetical protein